MPHPDVKGYVLLLYDPSGHLFGIHGPFRDREAANVWAKCQAEFRAEVLVLWRPD